MDASTDDLPMTDLPAVDVLADDSITVDAGQNCQIPSPVSTAFTVPSTCTVVEVTQDLEVEGGTLTIGPDTLLRFAAGTSLIVGKTKPSGLKIQGAAGQLVRLTVAGDGGAGARWGGIRLGPFTSAGTVIDYGLVEYIGPSTEPSIEVDETVIDGSISITNTTVRHCDGTCISNAGDPGSLFAKFSGNTVENAFNKYSLALSPRVVTTIEGKSSNTLTAPIAVTAGEITTVDTWKAQSTELAINGKIIVGSASGADLTIETNVLKFGKTTAILVGPSAVKPGGLHLDSVTLSPRAGSPAPGEWAGIQFGEGATASTLDGCAFNWAGSVAGAGQSTSVITISGPTTAAGIAVTNCTMTNSGSTYSIYASDAQGSDCDKYSEASANNTFDKAVHCGQ